MCPDHRDKEQTRANTVPTPQAPQKQVFRQKRPKAGDHKGRDRQRAGGTQRALNRGHKGGSSTSAIQKAGNRPGAISSAVKRSRAMHAHVAAANSFGGRVSCLPSARRKTKSARTRWPRPEDDALPNERIVCASAYARRKEGRRTSARPNTALERRAGDDGASRGCPSKPHNDPPPSLHRALLRRREGDSGRQCSMRSHGASPA